MGHLQVSKLIAAPVEAVFAHVTRFENLPLWLGDGLKIDVVTLPKEVKERAEAEFVFRRFGFVMRVRARIEELRHPERISYRQTEGFFREWSHTQILRAHDSRTTLLTDLIEFKMPLGIIGALADDLVVRREIERCFAERSERIDEILKDRVPGATLEH